MRSLIKRIGIAATIGAALLLVAAACSERESPLGRTDLETGTIDREPLSFDALKLNDYGDSPSRQIITAYATHEDPSLPQQPMPVLYLLHDWSGDALEFQGYNLQALLSDMYARGEIGRMMVVTVDASNGLGGSFYRNAGTMGNYEDVLTATIDHIEKHTRAYTAGGRMAFAISGHGMGGYGAFRYALDRPEKFGAVSSMSGPLSFGDRDSDFGIWASLVPSVFTEIDIVPPDAEKNVYPRLAAGRHAFRNTSLFLAMSGAFSPHPLRRLDSLGMLVLCRVFTNCVRKDTFYNQPFFSALPAGSQTLRIRDVGDTLGVGIDMIFDSTGTFAENTWQRWLDSADVKTVFARNRLADPAFFDNTALYIDVGEDDEFGFRGQNEDFDRFLREEAGITHHVFEVYPGYGGTPAGHWDLIQSRLRKLIKFHDALFVRPPSPNP